MFYLIDSFVSNLWRKNMTKKEYIFWLLSSIFLMIGLIFLFIPSHSIQNYSFPFLIIGLLLVFFIKEKKAPKKPVAKKFYQKKIFWAWIFIPLIVVIFIYSIILKEESPYNFMMIILVADMIIVNYFGTKYKW